MSTDNPDRLISHPIADLLKIERREQLVPNLFFAKGEEAVDFSDGKEVDKLIKHLNGTPRPLIVADALADILGDLNEDKSHDINQVYRNIWRVVYAHDTSFGVLHHSGWDEKRERGSTAIRAKSDILVQIVDFDPEKGRVELKHHKLPGGAPLKQFFLSVKLVPVGGYPQPIPIVTGPKSELEAILSEPAGADEHNARTLVEIMVQHFPQGATFTQLRELSEVGKTTFNSALACAKGKSWIAGGGGRGQRYNLQPDGSWQDSEQSSVQSVHPHRGVKPIRTDQLSSNEPKPNQLRTDEPNASCKNANATANGKNPNEIKESESSPPVSPGPSDDELIKQGMEKAASAAKPRA
jgi:hypothetical protein